MNDSAMTVAYHPTPWNKGKLIGQKPPLKLREIWALRTRLEMAGKTKELALFNLAIDSKLRGCDLVQLRVNDVARGGEVLTRASVIQQKTREPVRFELTDPTRVAVAAWIAKANLTSGSYLFPSRQHDSLHLSVRQYARIVKRWVALIGGNPQEYGTHSLRRTKATLIYRRTKNLRAVQLLLGHRKLESTGATRSRTFIYQGADLMFSHQSPIGPCVGGNPGVRSVRDNVASVLGRATTPRGSVATASSKAVGSQG